MSDEPVSETAQSDDKLRNLEAKILAADDRIKDLAAKNESIQTQIARYKLLSAAGSIALAAGGIALFFVFNLVDDEVQRLVRATEPIEKRQAQITDSANALNLRLASIDAKIAETGRELEGIAANALDGLTTEIDRTVEASADSLEQKRDELLANLEFDTLTVKSIRVVDENGDESVRMATGQYGGEVRIFDPQNGLNTVFLGNESDRLGYMGMHYPDTLTGDDRALEIQAGRDGGIVKIFNKATGNEIAFLGVSAKGHGGVWLSSESGKIGSSILGDGGPRLRVFSKDGRTAAKLDINGFGGFLETTASKTGKPTAQIGSANNEANGGIWLYDEKANLRGIFYADESIPNLKINGEDERDLIRLMVDRRKRGNVEVRNSDGKLVASVEGHDNGAYFRANSPATGRTVAIFGGSSGDAGFLDLRDNESRNHLSVASRLISVLFPGGGEVAFDAYLEEDGELFINLAPDLQTELEDGLLSMIESLLQVVKESSSSSTKEK